MVGNKDSQGKVSEEGAIELSFSHTAMEVCPFLVSQQAAGALEIRVSANSKGNILHPVTLRQSHFPTVGPILL